MKMLHDQVTSEPDASLRGRGDTPTGTAGDGHFPLGWSTLVAIETRRDVLRRAVLGASSLSLGGLLAACGGSGDASRGNEARADAPATGVDEVAVRDDYFEPVAIQVPAGTTVTWRWEGKHDHNVVADDFESATQTAGSFAQTFAEPGRHEYRCTLHGGMRGEVVVTGGDRS